MSYSTCKSRHVTSPLSGTRRTLLWVAVVSGLFLATLDQTIVSTALVTIVDDLGDSRWYVWTFVGYLVPSTVLLPVAARLSDRLGRRAVLQGGMALFVAGSASCAAATSMVGLVAGRALQGSGAAALEALSFLLVNEIARRRGTGQAVISAVMALSFVAGPVLGGSVTAHAGWRWTFAMNVPVGAAALILVAIALPRDFGRTESAAVPVDVRGMACLVASVGTALVGVSHVPLVGWTDPLVIGALGVTAVAGYLFVRVEQRAAAPLVPLRLLTDRTTGRLLLTGAFASTGLFVAVVLVPRWFQVAQGATPTEAGIRTYPLLFALLVGVNLGAAAVVRLGDVRRPLLLAAAMTCAGGLLFLLVGSGSSAGIVAAMVALGLGVGPALSGLQVALVRAVAPAHLAAAFGLLLLGRQVVGCFAMTIGDAIYQAGGRTDGPAAATGPAVAVVTVAGSFVAAAALAKAPRRLPPNVLHGVPATAHSAKNPS